MKKLSQFIDATFLKTENEGLTAEEIKNNVDQLINDANSLQTKIVMIRSNWVKYAKDQLQNLKSKVGVGTVIDFPFGNGGIDLKVTEAKEAIDNNADELDFVINYQAFKKGEIQKVKDEVYVLSKICLDNNKIVKWIIETAALSDQEIIKLTVLIKNVIVSKFSEKCYDKVFIKSSTGFYKTIDGSPNGANKHVVTLMLENATPLLVKASGGVQTKETALEMIAIGVKRIGTSSHVAILKE